jgi:hypothetical protein
MMRREAEEHVNDNEVKHMNLLLARLEVALTFALCDFPFQL